MAFAGPFSLSERRESMTTKLPLAPIVTPLQPEGAVLRRHLTRAERRERGICCDCLKPAVPDRLRCQAHLAANAQRVATWAKSDRGRESRRRRAEYFANWRRKHRRTAGRYTYVRELAARRGVSWALTKEQYEALIMELCAYCGLLNDVEAAIGLDRIDNQRGYEPDNVVSCCSLCNVARGDMFTPEEMKVLGAAIRQIRLARMHAGVSTQWHRKPVLILPSEAESLLARRKEKKRVRAVEAIALRRQGQSYSQIATRMGISHSYAYALVTETLNAVGEAHVTRGVGADGVLLTDRYQPQHPSREQHHEEAA